MCTMVKDTGARELAWVWVLILGLPSTSCVTLDTRLSLSEPWFRPCEVGVIIYCHHRADKAGGTVARHSVQNTFTVILLFIILSSPTQLSSP